ncbi:hypothetical protein HWV62_30025 [Athelia sp. TMB]|nr:hypothetical protein HWV62_30025 [Athelia sp. TMB]
MVHIAARGPDGQHGARERHTSLLQDETPLVPRAWYAHNSNFSLKYTAQAGTADGRHFSSTYLLSRADIDIFKDEVKRRATTSADSENMPPDAPQDALNEPGDVTNVQEVKTTCSKNWKAAANNSKKSAFEIYETNGVFPVACRHGLIVTFTEIIWSGELAKYLLATTNFLLDMFSYNIGLGADISCAFSETIKHSNLLKNKAAEQRLQVVINTFHGWAHNRLFFHVHHINYKQALVIIRDYTPQIAAFKVQFLVTDADIEGWVETKLKFLQDLKDEPEECVLAVSYVDTLILLQKAE